MMVPNSFNYNIRPASVDEADLLTALSLASKKYWNYPDSYFEIWLQELAMTPSLIEFNDVFVYEEQETVSGYYSLVTLDSDVRIGDIAVHAGTWLEHMFVAPDRIGETIGSRLFAHMRTIMQKKGLHSVGILADPHALGFYRKMGCTYIREFPSSIKGRTTPYLCYEY